MRTKLDKIHIKQNLPFILVFILIATTYISNIKSDFDKDMQTNDIRNLLTSDDLLPNTFLPYLAVKEKTLKFNSVYKLLKRFGEANDRPYFLIRSGQDYYSSYPIATGLISVPFYAIPILLNKIPSLTYHENILKILILGRITAIFYTLLSCFVFLLIIKKFTKNKFLIITYLIFYALGTTTWSISSRGLWMHTLSQLFISLIFLLLLKLAEIEDNKSDPKPKSASKAGLISWLSVLSSLSVLTRLTNIFFALAVTLYILIFERKHFLNFILVTIPFIIILGLYNYSAFGNPLMEGYQSRGDTTWTASLLTSVPGFLFSPARSFLFISPPLVFGLIETIKFLLGIKNRGSQKDLVCAFLSGSFIIFFIVISKWWAWSGANGFGYRMLTEALPIVATFSLIFLENILLKANFGVLKVGLIILVIYSIYVQTNAIYFRKSRCSEEQNWSFYCLSVPNKTLEKIHLTL